MIYRGDGNFELLGGPIGTNSFCNQHTQKRVDKAVRLLKEIGEVPDPMVAFGKLVYSMRVVPHSEHACALGKFDEAVRECFESFMCSNL